VAIDLETLRYEPLTDTCPKGAFSCGDATLDKWFTKESHKRHADHTCRVTTVHLGDNPAPVGYYAMGIILEEDRLLKGDGPIRRRVFQRVYPALHLEYIAVHTDFQGNDIGTDMMVRVIETFRKSVLDFGIPVLTLSPLNDDLVKFYEGIGFQKYAQHLGMKRMLLPAKTVLDMYEKAQLPETS
jgi:ribosomal protein S18 acetylase RimI-like enzyme